MKCTLQSDVSIKFTVRFDVLVLVVVLRMGVLLVVLVLVDVLVISYHLLSCNILGLSVSFFVFLSSLSFTHRN